MRTIKIENRESYPIFKKFQWAHERVSWLLLNDFLPNGTNSRIYIHMYSRDVAYLL